MDNKTQSNYRRLTLDNRIELHRLLCANLSITECGRKLGVATSTIAREVKRNRTDEGRFRFKTDSGNLCRHRRTCTVKALCEGGRCWNKRCRSCRQRACQTICTLYEKEVCKIKTRAPYCCNGCPSMSGCKMHRYRYDAKIAQAKADKRLTQSRVGINMTAEDFETMVALVWPLIRNQGQSPRQIWLTYAEELPCSERSLYRYVEGCLGDMRRIHMPKAAAYKPRKRRVIRTSAELAGRNFADFCALDEEIRASAVEMDCVEGIISDSRCLMTLYLRPFKLLIMLMLPTQNRAHTASALDWLEKTIGKAAFQRHFSIILTDRGQEFLGFEELERSVDGSRRCHIYYCDAMRANQKGQIENAHRYIRRILPKGTSLDGISPLEVAHIASHINSAPRPSLGGASPFELACVRINNKTLEKLGLSLVHPDKVCLKPSLLEDLRRSDV